MSTNSHLSIENRALIVDDELLNRNLMVEFLDILGWTSETAEDGLQCVERLESGDTAYSAILMDVHMPHRSGIEVTGDIREFISDPPKNTPIIIVTADVSPATKTRCLDAGANAVLTKPVAMAELEAALQAANLIAEP